MAIIPDTSWLMQRLDQLEDQTVFSFLDERQQQLVRLAYTLLQREIRTQTRFSDYSFVVFPMAKAYEGFLKSFLRQFGMISEATYRSRRFRIGRALNPDVSPRHRDHEWLYDDVARLCGQQMSRQLWETWLICRNQLVHYFPDQVEGLSLAQATQQLEMIFQAMDDAVQCVTTRES